jgi:aminoglycoside phosphotransferase (APT) family kinase protein
MTSEENRVQEAAKRARARSLAELTPPLERWLADRLEVAGLALELRHPVGAGTSSETILGTAAWSRRGIARRRHVVFRLQPDGFQLFREPRFDLQFNVLKAVHDEGTVRVPEPLFFESDGLIVGLPFFAMELVEGDVPVGNPHFATAGFLFDATTIQRRVAWESAVRQLGAVATVSLKTRDILEPLVGLRTQTQEIAYWKRSATWACEGAVPDWLAALGEWLERYAPDEPDGLSWGDARIGNLAFGKDFRVKAVFDWEQASNAGVREDLGWWLLFDRYQVNGLGHPRLDGFGTRDETIALWEHVAGVMAGDVSWFETFAGYKLSIIGVRALMLQGHPDARSVTANPVPRLALETAGLTSSGNAS